VYEQQSIAAMLPETPEEIALLRLVEAEPRHIDLIARESALPQPVVSSTLAMLELKGLVRQVGGMQYALIREESAGYAVESASFQLDPIDPAITD
jgi:DNA processing protein